MKVLKQPDTTNWFFKHICDKCDAELEVEASDLKHRHYEGDQREPSYDEFKAACVVCGDVFLVPSKHIPKLIQVNTIKKSSTGGYYS